MKSESVICPRLLGLFQKRIDEEQNKLSKSTTSPGTSTTTSSHFETPPTPTIGVAGIIEVAGITELPFTGMNPIIPLSGISIMVIGAALLMVSLIRRKRIKKIRPYKKSFK